MSTHANNHPPLTPTDYILNSLDDAMQQLIPMLIAETSLRASMTEEGRCAFVCEAEQIVYAVRTLLRVHRLTHRDPRSFEDCVNLHHTQPRAVCQNCIDGDGELPPRVPTSDS